MKPNVIIVQTDSVELFQEFLKTLASSLHSPTIEKYDGDAQDVPRLVTGVLNTNLFSPKKLAVIRISEKSRLKMVPELLDRLHNVPESTTVVIELLRTGIEQRIKKTAESFNVPVKVLGDSTRQARQKVSRVQNLLEKKGLKATRDAVSLLEALAEDFDTLAGEIDKLAVFKSGTGDVTVTRNDVMLLIALPASFDLFAFINALLLGRRKEMLRMIRSLEETGAPDMIMRIIHLAARQVMAAVMVTQGVNAQQIVSVLRVPSFAVRRIEKMRANLNPARLAETLELLVNLDVALKFRRTSPADAAVRLALNT